MAIDLDDLKTIYQEFLDGSKTALLEVQKQTQMEDEHFATAVAQIISNTMTSSIQALDVIHGITIKSEQSAKDLLVKDAQIASENASKDLKMQQKTSMIAEDTIKSEQSAKDLLVKDAQIASENASKDLKMQQKTSMIAEDTIKSAQSAKDLLVKDAQIASENASKDLKVQQKTSMIAEDTIKSAQSAKDLLVKDAQKILLTNQAASEVNKGALLVRQTSALDDARNVKKAEILGETIGMIQGAGITPPSNMQTDFTSALKAIV